jgi:radical SAM superfamily enzyme YgiQ (UPF0313 family)
MKKITFIEPRGVVKNLFPYYSSFPLMGPVYLGTILHNKGYKVRIYSENMVGRDAPDEFLDTDFLCLSMLTLTAPRGYEIARKFRQINPGGKIIMGGIHPTFMPEEAIEHSDLVVRGEAENLILDLIEYGWTEKIVNGKPVEDLDSLPLPNWNLVYNSDKIYVKPVMTSRGCPYDCTFCTVTKMFGRHYRFNSPERVLEEIFSTNHRRIFFYDDNFGANRRRLQEILKGMIQRNFDGSWYAQLRTDVTKVDETVRLMAESDCGHVLIGFESISNKTLEEYNKHQNSTDILNSIKTFHKHGIGVHGMFVLGADSDGPDVFQETLNFCMENELDTAQFGVLTPFPGTGTYYKFKKQNRILHQKWQYYDGMHVVFKPKKMSVSELQQGIINSFGDFYSLIHIVNDAIEAITYSALSLFTKKMNPGLQDAIVRLAVRSSFLKWKEYIKSYNKFLDSVAQPDN